MRNTIQNDIMKNTMKVAKRITITILICLPFLVVFAYLTRKVITQNWLQILCFVIIMGVTVLIEEIVARKREARKQAKEMLEGKKDVFK